MSIYQPDAYDLEHLKRLRLQAREAAPLQSLRQEHAQDEINLSVADLQPSKRVAPGEASGVHYSKA